jgi:formate hydrogenlyase transcriptional activator
VLKVPVSDLKRRPDTTSPSAPKHDPVAVDSLKDRLGENERHQILTALEQSDWVVAGPNGAAARLGMKRSTLQFRMRKLGIQISRNPHLNR